jgi:hypothetical protein
VCFLQDCTIDENGLITGAAVGGTPLCLSREFTLPEDFGRVVDFYLGGWD